MFLWQGARLLSVHHALVLCQNVVKRFSAPSMALSL